MTSKYHVSTADHFAAGLLVVLMIFESRMGGRDFSFQPPVAPLCCRTSSQFGFGRQILLLR